MKMKVMVSDVYTTKKGAYISTCVSEEEGGGLGVVKIYHTNSASLPADKKSHIVEVKPPGMVFLKE